MPDFDRERESLSHQRRELDRKRRDALLAREALRQAERALDEFGRVQGRGRETERARLEGQVERARARAKGLEDELRGLRGAADERLQAFEAFTDPRRHLGKWSSRVPVLLFPLRLETRFKSDAGGQPQLWVRVYPDTCLIDSFEPSLTAQEVANGRAFWAAVWRAGGDEALERAAWRDLVASHGSGRAGWIVREYLPRNPGDKPARNTPTDVLLIITASGPLPAAAATYWEAAWKADGAPAALEAARAALEQAVGPEQAREIAEHYRPFNFDDAPAAPRAKAEVQVKVAVLQVTEPAAMETRRTSWSSAPRVNLLPERLVLVAEPPTGPPLVEIGRLVRTPLVAGPDPNAAPAEQLQPVDDTLQIPEPLAWMFDFERALEAGMAFRVNLSPDQARDGFERVFVLGVRLADSPDEGRQELETLLEHHLYSRPGFEILPQGTPTNNTEHGGSGYSFGADPDSTFTTFFQRIPQYTPQGDPLLRRDGQWLAELLGLRHDLVQRVPNAGAQDQSEARAMQIALWPGTLGYTMTSLLAPVFGEDEIVQTRAFFTRYVHGRGPLPALRIGAQPYGILPTTAFDQVAWFETDKGLAYLRRLHRILKRIDDDWKPLLDRISHVGKAGDPHQILLDVLGLHPSAVEYYPLQADGVEHKFFELAFLDFSLALDFLHLFPAAVPLALLRSFGYTGTEIPDLLNKIYRARQTPLTGPVIDDRPLSEAEPIRQYAGSRNYIEWLVEAAETGIEAIQQERGFDAGKKPAALLYLLLRHALQIGFHETGVKLGAAGGALADVRAARREPPFVHVREEPGASESRYDLLFRADPAITRVAGVKLGDHIARNVRAIDPELREQIQALERLARVPTARLERVFAEHVDCCSHRLDAWKMSVLSWQLERLRAPGGRPASTGLHLGAFGWLEPLRPEPKVLTPLALPPELGERVNRRDRAPLLRDSTNGGLIHAPSLNHATTAAVLRNGYVANEGRLAVNLSSRRVRLALEILEGMRTGQPLGALLGYQFERHVHDHGPLQVRDLVYPLRRAFPLVANQIARTQTEAGEARESIAAMNVVDGRKLIEHVERTQSLTYPFGVTTLPRRDAAQEGALTAALHHIRDINDAVADLVLAEGVHQAVLGNFDRSAGVLDAFAKGSYPPEPEVIRTPRTGIALTLRTAIHLMAVPPADPLPGIPFTPLAEAEPRVNAWLAERLPAPALVGCRVTFVDRATDVEDTVFVTQDLLGLHTIDLVYRAEAGTDQALGQLDDQIVRYVYANHAPRHDRPIRIRHTERVAGRVTWFELQPLLRSLRALVVASRPLAPADLVRANDATRDEQAAVSLARGRVEGRRDHLRDVLLPTLDALTAALGNPAVTIDGALSQLASTFGAFAAYRLPHTGAGFAFEWRAGAYTALARKVEDRVATWNERLARYDQSLTDYDLLPPATPEAERITKLQAAQIILETALTTPTPATAAAYRAALDARRLAFVTKRDALQDLVDTARPTLAQLLDDTKAELPLTEFDPGDLDLAGEEEEIVRFRAQLTGAVARLKADAQERIGRVDALLARHDTAGPVEQVRLLQEAAKILLGDDFQMVPSITLPADAADELANAWQHSVSGDLTRYLTDTAGREFPVDDWLHGIARVRDKMHHWENAVLLGDAFAVARPTDLTPLQLPHHANEPWLGLEMPEGHTITGDRLLYTAHFAEPYDRTTPICGLLVDEWTEIVPGADETTGIAFHYDRPSSEPPQSWLLALSASGEETWSWEELLAAVRDALETAKRRAIEPVHIDGTAYAWFLPATMSAYTFPEISISNNLLRNRDLYAVERLRGPVGQE